MREPILHYAISIQVERFHRTLRFHWTICSVRNPDELVSWGHAPTRELAETQAQSEIQDLRSGLTKGGRVRESKESTYYRRP